MFSTGETDTPSMFAWPMGDAIVIFKPFRSALAAVGRSLRIGMGNGDRPSVPPMSSDWLSELDRDVRRPGLV